jgi:hypothetical protein
MDNQLTKECDELREKMRKYDEALLKLIKQGPVDLIIKTIKDYLQQHES